MVVVSENAPLSGAAAPATFAGGFAFWRTLKTDVEEEEMDSSGNKETVWVEPGLVRTSVTVGPDVFGLKVPRVVWYTLTEVMVAVVVTFCV